MALLHAASLYDEKNNLIGSNTVIFDLTDMDDQKIKEYEKFFKNAEVRLDEIRHIIKKTELVKFIREDKGYGRDKLYLYEAWMHDLDGSYLKQIRLRSL